MIQIYFNQEKIMIGEITTLVEVLNQRMDEHSLFAIAINRRFIARGYYASTLLQEGDLIEIISPMQGG